MRRKIERSTAVRSNNNTILMVLFVVCTFIMVTAGIAAIMVLADTGVKSFVMYQDQYDIQNECIAELVSNGIPRKDITRTENGCAFNIGE